MTSYETQEYHIGLEGFLCVVYACLTLPLENLRTLGAYVLINSEMLERVKYIVRASFVIVNIPCYILWQQAISDRQKHSLHTYDVVTITSFLGISSKNSLTIQILSVKTKAP